MHPAGVINERPERRLSLGKRRHELLVHHTYCGSIGGNDTPTETDHGDITVRQALDLHVAQDRHVIRGENLQSFLPPAPVRTQHGLNDLGHQADPVHGRHPTTREL